MQLEKVYEPQQFEPHWAKWWIDNGVFAADAESEARMYSLVIPPPNVTGSLHMGHMLEHTIIDVTIRWHRMKGDNTLWLPGTDHAGIATQMVVERKLKAEGLTRHDLGRERFEAKVWEWKKEYGGNIVNQMIRLGASCDWSRERFTLDEGLNKAVREVFVRLWEKGLIYRGEYMINWCPRCSTALSDLEVDYDQTQGNLWHIRYPVKDSDEFVTVATTRPETMLGDTAVAVHPEDERYKHLHGKTVVLPLMDREIPVIADEFADPEFGTGVVKVTPAHDPNDFEAGRRHKLAIIKVIGENAAMTNEAGIYAGLGRYEARKKVVADLDEKGLLQKTDAYDLNLSKCQRCKETVEPLVSKQWFVSMKDLAKPAIEVVESGRIKFIPENWTKTYYEWMYNIRDWCISRQLWWGHRIPAWHCGDCGEVVVARDTPEKCPKCGSANLTQDTDVLDTWFSSGLWPFSTMGWPDETKDLKTFYPTSLLITGFDILFFWVARMIVSGMEFMGDVPFRTVYIHGLVRDADKQKMSKTKGNVIDPLVVTEKYGTDAVRMSLLLGAAPGTDIVLTEERMVSSRAFANKIWNAARFLGMKMEASGVEPHIPDKPELDGAPLEDRWMFSRLNACAEQLNKSIENYRYHEVAQNLWHFFWHEFCDWYVEIKKLRLAEGSGLTADWKNVLAAFESALRMLHPAMPFITEELWQRLAQGAEGQPTSIARAGFPQPQKGWSDEAAEKEMGLLQEIIVSARNLRSQMKIEPKEFLGATLHAGGAAHKVATENAGALEKLARVRLTVSEEAAPEKGVVKKSTPEFDLVLDVGAGKIESARKALEKDVAQLEKLVNGTTKQLSNENFVRRAPASVVEETRGKLAGYEAKLAKSREALAGLG